jgi:NADP-reducing hydrogenase subunit HndC
MLEILTRICAGDGEPADIDRLVELGNTIKATSLCGLGQTAPNPVLSTIRYFRDEYESHVNDKKCLAGTCKALVNFTIDAEVCTGCGICMRDCPTNAITGEKKQAHIIDHAVCIQCGVCRDQCPFGAITP